MADNQGEITLLLHRWTAGDQDALNHIFELLEPELKQLARRLLVREYRNHTLQRTELVNELFLKLAKSEKIEFADRNHFIAVCTMKVKWTLIERVREKRIELIAMEGLPEGSFGYSSKLELMLVVSELLDKLSRLDPTRYSVVVLRSYLGCTTKEVGELLGISENVVEHEFHRGRKWLFKKLGEDPPCQALGTSPSR
ncbi:MAG: sigma-70 family RNA polymerase sigma factor [Actinomycetota bacterium]